MGLFSGGLFFFGGGGGWGLLSEFWVMLAVAWTALTTKPLCFKTAQK